MKIINVYSSISLLCLESVSFLCNDQISRIRILIHHQHSIDPQWGTWILHAEWSCARRISGLGRSVPSEKALTEWRPPPPPPPLCQGGYINNKVGNGLLGVTQGIPSLHDHHAPCHQSLYLSSYPPTWIINCQVRGWCLYSPKSRRNTI